MSFEKVDENNPRSNAAVALGLYPPRPRYNGLGGGGSPSSSSDSIEKQILNCFDEFETEDIPYLLWVLHRSNLNSTSFTPHVPRVKSMLRTASKQQDAVIRRRALTLIASLYKSTRLEFRKEIRDAFQRENWISEADKLALISSLHYRQLWDVQVFNAAADFKDVGSYASIIRLAEQLNPESFELFFADLLAKESKCLDGIHQPIGYDDWNGKPIKVAGDPVKKTMFEQILDLLDGDPEIGSALFDPSKKYSVPVEAALNTAILNLRARQSKSSGAIRKKLDRVLKRIDPDNWTKNLKE